MRHIQIIGALVALSGCATVQSTQISDFSKAEKGLTYFLPMRHVKLTATKELLDPPKIKAVLETKTKELDSAKAAAALAEQNAKAKADILANLKPTDADATRASVTQSAQIAMAEAAIAVAQRDGLASTVSGLKKLLETAQASPTDTCGYTAKLELLPPQGDRTMRFVAMPRHNPLRDDNTKLVVTGEGLLSSANIVAADRTGDIIVELAGAISSLARGVAGAATTGAPVENDCLTARKFIRVFNPASDDFATVTSELAAARYPLLISREDLEGSAVVRPTIDEKPTDAIFYRTPLPVRIRISECGNAGIGCSIQRATVLEEVLVSIPQAGPVSYIPQRSSAFVKTVNDVQFDNGVIKSWSADQPSEVLEVVRLPVRIMTAIISVPASLIQLRVNYDSQAKNLADMQAAERASSMRLRMLQACLDAAGEDNVAAKACLSQ